MNENKNNNQEVCEKRWYEILLAFFQSNPEVAKIFFLAMSIGFVFVAIGVAANLAVSTSVIDFVASFFRK